MTTQLRRRNHIIGGGFVFNRQPLTNWKAARAAVKAGTGRAKVIFAGDSSAGSYGSDTQNGFVAPNTVDARLARQFTTEGLPSTYQAEFGGHGATALNIWDFRSAQGAFAYSNPATFGIMPGGEFLSASGAATVSFAPADPTQTAVATDTCDIWYAQDSSAGSFSKQVDAGTATTINANGSSLITKTTVSATSGNHTYKMNWVSGTAYYLGMHAYSSAVKAVDFWNMGSIGSWAQQWAGTGFFWEPGNTSVWTAFAPNIVLFSAGANDILGGASVATTQPYVVATINAIKAMGADVVVMGYNPIRTTVASVATQVALRKMMYDAAISTGCTFIDFLSMMGGPLAWDTNNANGLMFDDEHRSFKGYTSAVKVIHDILNS